MQPEPCADDPEPPGLHRHQLVWLKERAWPALLAAADNCTTQAGLAHWARHDLPLVVVRQDKGCPVGEMSLGLPLPTRWGRQRLRLQAACADVARVGRFPPASTAMSLLAADLHPAFAQLCECLAKQRLPVRVYGSFGWQCLTGLDHVHQASDLDLLVPVRNAACADAAVRSLGCFAAPMHLDGELIFPDGSAVAWREWPHWRSGQVAQLMIKRNRSVALTADSGWLAQACRPGTHSRA